MWWMLAALAAEPVVRGNLVLDNIPETTSEVKAGLHPYQNVRGAGFLGFVPGGGMFVNTRFGDVSQLHRVVEPGAAREQLTFFPEPLRNTLPSPVNADEVLVMRDTGGDEQFQLWLLNLKSRSLTQLSGGTGRVEAAAWAPDGSSVAYSEAQKGKDRAVVVVDPSEPDGRRQLWKGEGAFSVKEWTPDQEKLLLEEYISLKESRLYLLPVKRATLAQINPSRKPIGYRSMALSADGGLYVSSDEGSDRSRLWRIDLKGGAKKALTDGALEVDSVRVSPDGAQVAYTLNDLGRSKLVLKTAKGFTDVPMPKIPDGVIRRMGFNSDGTQFGFMLSRPDAPTDVFSFEVGKSELVQWTKSEVGGLDTSTFVKPEFFSVSSFDGLDVPAYAFIPEGDGPHPVVISIHGGPEAQARPYFSSTYQHWANELGVAVVVPNVRGSAGFGRAYHQADNDLKRKDSVKDIGAILDWIGGRKDLDAERVVVYGGSYGGYMVLASLIDYADRLAGGVDSVGISDFKTFLKNTKDYRRDLRRAEYGDERIPKVARFFDEISPLKNASKIEDPLFVIQGANDPRVPASEAEQIVAAVRKSGVEAWYLLAKDEGHGFRKKRNRDVQNESVAMFLKKVFGL